MPSPSQMTIQPIRVRTPATTANLGAGFDCIGAALTIYNQATFSPADTLEIAVVGEEAAKVETTDTNLIYRAFAYLFGKLNQPVPGVKLEIELGVPLARGLGSSATAIVAGLVGANHFAGNPFSREEIGTLATEMEGHPDNVIPALMGGCRLAATDRTGGWVVCPIDWQPEIIPVVAIPNFELSTETARQVLPSQYSRADAVFNIAHLGLLLRGLATNNPDWLRASLADRIHQPYRQSLIRGYAEVEAAAIAAGAYGLVISGAGPTLLALTSPLDAPNVVAAMRSAWQGCDVTAQAMALELDNVGTTVV
jgi:homoserine kinase